MPEMLRLVKTLKINTRNIRVLLSGFLILFIVSGVCYYGFGVFFKHIQEEFGWGRGVISTAFLTFCLVFAFFSPIIGKLIDRYGARNVILIGSFLLGSGLILLSITTNLQQFYMAYGIVGLGGSGCGLVSVSSLISEWFSKRRGTALGLVTSGMGIGGLFMPIIIGNFLIPCFGWRTAYQILGLLTIAIITLILMKALPSRGRPRSGNPQYTNAPPTKSIKEEVLKSALRKSTFWLIVCAYILFEIAETGTVQHLVIRLIDVGFPEAMATFVFSFIGLFNVIGRFLFGYISDRLAIKFCAIISFSSGLVATTLLMAIIAPSNLLLICLFILAMGLTVGSWAPITSMLISTYFEAARYGTVFGAFSLFFFVSSGVGPALFGYIYDAVHNYNPAYILSLTFYSIAIILISSLPRQNQS